MKGVAIPFSNFKGYYYDVVYANSSGVYVDGDREEVIVLNPNDYLVGYLKENKIPFRWLSKEEVDRYVREFLHAVFSGD